MGMIQLTDYFMTQDKCDSLSVEYNIGKLPFSYSNQVIAKKEPLQLQLQGVEKGKVRLSGNTRIQLVLPCDRCLKDTEVDIPIAFEREVVSPERLEEDADQKDDQLFVEEYQLDVDCLMTEELVINWPREILCQEDCKGLCPKCGHHLNEGECGCDTFVPDPRFAGLADLLK